MARKAKRHSAKAPKWPIVNFTKFKFKPEFSPFCRLLLFWEFVLCGLCVFGAAVLLLLKLVNRL
ncbi:hypothetical protein COS54_01840 [Candidatus Shapirobacteria bacterium CG03_land_8_20_14_0_80_39_12]|uniref:Uncharacterized protein n=1 Tax=Candidatus Shapirobacteria bacterium CG03_land_8_20_14_0_80_39_12 TaxID=1974879 RepID=A0A2M7BD14_9BACT|nr:MAG: hypothetical protein COS54_01840 [Candidatus Shapirobacteria bacterium CG03_land_8_20_14_0_80_39_12]